MSTNSRRAQTLTVNTMVIAALSILVLVIGVIIYSGMTDDSVDSLRSCENRNGACQPECGDGEQELFGASCPDDQICCLGG